MHWLSSTNCWAICVSWMVLVVAAAAAVVVTAAGALEPEYVVANPLDIRRQLVSHELLEWHEFKVRPERRAPGEQSSSPLLCGNARRNNSSSSGSNISNTADSSDCISYDSSSSARDPNISWQRDQPLFVEFASHGRHFALKLQPVRGLFSRAARLSATARHSTIQDHTADLRTLRGQYLEGEVVGEPRSHVALYYDGESLSGSIHLQDDVYTVEKAPPATGQNLGEASSSSSSSSSPLSSHGSPFPAGSAYIVYKDSEIKLRPKRAGSHGVTDTVSTSNSVDHHHRRTYVMREDMRRVVDQDAPPGNKQCLIRLVADHTYFRVVGEGNLRKTIDQMVTQILRVNVMFRKTAFRNTSDSSDRNMGFLIQDVHIFEEPTHVEEGARPHFNMAGDIDVEDMLQSFAIDEADENQWVCLAHLFTARSFSDKVLGRAFVGHATAERGICARKVPLHSGRENDTQIVRNVGITTSVRGGRLLMRVSDMTVAHELGHGWGAQHDPDTPECLPPDSRGGAYIMSTHSNTGFFANNGAFSPCSIRQIGVVLKYKSDCFVRRESSTCGNFMVDDGEECDVGSIRDNDPCCTRACRLRDGARCSDLNDACCVRCQVAPKGTLCRPRRPHECLDYAFCSGETERCPRQRSLPDNSSCSDRGTCLSGQCTPFCESIGSASCLCDGRHACYRCCRRTPADACVPVQPIDVLADGTMCRHGYCEAGRCVKTVQDVVPRLLDIIRKVRPSWIVAVVKRYPVPLVIVTLSLLWIPCAIMIHYYDKNLLRASLQPSASATLRSSVTGFRFRSTAV